MQVLKIVLSVAGIVLFILLGHIALIAPDPDTLWRQLAMLLVVVPIIGICAWGVGALLKKAGLNAFTSNAAAATGALATGALAMSLWPQMVQRLDWIYLAQHTASNLLLCYFFARTLLPGRTPVVTTLARTIHGPLPKNIDRYTRNVTLAWSLFFAGQVLVSFFIFFFMSVAAWSWYANVLNWPLVGVMFVGEYLCRKIMNPDFAHAGLRQSINAFRQHKEKL